MWKLLLQPALWKPTAGEMSTTQLPVSSSADDHLQTRDCQLVNTRTTVTPENFNPLSHYDITGRHYTVAESTTRFGGKPKLESSWKIRHKSSWSTVTQDNSRVEVKAGSDVRADDRGDKRKTMFRWHDFCSTGLSTTRRTCECDVTDTSRDVQESALAPSGVSMWQTTGHVEALIMK